MNTQSAVRESLVIPPVADIVDSIAGSAAKALGKFDERSANSTHIEMQAQPVSAAYSDWLQQSTQPPNSFGQKSGALAVVALVHVVAVYVVTQMAPQIHKAIAAPLQVVMIDSPQVQQETPPPPMPQLRVPEFNLPVEPVINIALPETNNSITVAIRPSEPTTGAVANGAPKVVSSVEYIREPVAKYPAAARALKQRGTVTLRAMIDATGHAREVNVHRSSGYRLLDDTAREAVLNALFKPYTENGHTIPVYVFIPIEFGASG